MSDGGSGEGREQHTFSPGAAEMFSAKASQPIIVAISWTRSLVSRLDALPDRSWESFTCRHGWRDTWTFFGSVWAMVSGILNLSNAQMLNGREYGEYMAVNMSGGSRRNEGGCRYQEADAEGRKAAASYLIGKKWGKLA